MRKVVNAVFISVPILLFFMLCIFIVGKNNKYISALMLTTISTSFFVLLMGIYIFKITNYTGMLLWEQNIYRFLISIPINYYVLIDLINFSVTMYLFIMWSIGALFVFSGNFGLRRYRRIYPAALIPAIAYGMVSSNRFSQKLFISINMSENPNVVSMFNNAAPTLNVFLNIIILAYLIMPLIIIRNVRVKQHFVYNRRMLGFFGISLALMDFIFGFSYKIGVMDLGLNSFTNLLRYSTASIKFKPYAYVLLVNILILVMFVLISAVKYRMWDLLSEANTSMRAKRSEIGYDDIRGLVHSFKTSIYSIILNLKDANECEDIGEIKGEITYITDWASDELKRIDGLLDVFKDGYNHMEYLNVVELIGAVTQSMAFPRNIRLKDEIPFESVTCRVQKFAFKETLKNIFSNSIDAIGKDANGEITICAECDNRWLFIGIRDNGCGIGKKKIKRIFDPLYSTKHPQVNWGVGLSYVKNTIKNLGGMVFAESKEGEYTEIQIILPYKRGEVKWK